MLAQLASVLAYKEHVDALMGCETKEQFFKLFESYFDEFTRRIVLSTLAIGITDLAVLDGGICYAAISRKVI